MIHPTAMHVPTYTPRNACTDVRHTYRVHYNKTWEEPTLPLCGHKMAVCPCHTAARVFVGGHCSEWCIEAARCQRMLSAWLWLHNDHTAFRGGCLCRPLSHTEKHDGQGQWSERVKGCGLLTVLFLDLGGDFTSICFITPLSCARLCFMHSFL